MQTFQYNILPNTTRDMKDLWDEHTINLWEDFFDHCDEIQGHVNASQGEFEKNLKKQIGEIIDIWLTRRHGDGDFDGLNEFANVSNMTVEKIQYEQLQLKRGLQEIKINVFGPDIVIDITNQIMDNLYLAQA
jgi:hypothetical protein